MSDSRPIGVFDSGIGGLTVAKALRELLPSEDIFYLGDTARVPYGNKSAETVERYSLELAGMLMRENAKTIVVACNTVSSVAIPKLRTSVSVPVIGVIEPGAQAAIAMTRNRHIGVIGTRATIRSGAYEEALRVNPTDTVTMTGLGRLYFNSKDWEKARKIYQSLVLQNIDNDASITKGEVYWALGKIHIELGQSPKAKSMFQRGLEIEPGNQKLREALSSLQ